MLADNIYHKKLVSNYRSLFICFRRIVSVQQYWT